MSKTKDLLDLLTASYENTDNLLRANFQLLDQVAMLTKEIELLKTKLAKAEAKARSLEWERLVFLYATDG